MVLGEGGSTSKMSCGCHSMDGVVNARVLE